MDMTFRRRRHVWAMQLSRGIHLFLAHVFNKIVYKKIIILCFKVKILFKLRKQKPKPMKYVPSIHDSDIGPGLSHPTKISHKRFGPF